ncbi:MAG: chemotaxis response regulator protein-glutamate methylesterase [Alphaproteobacteria bacterium]
MIVDDSAVIRGLCKRILESDPEIEVVASAGNGEHAVASVGRQQVDVVILDIEMPIMDGLTALPKILAADPGVRVIMSSTLTVRNADVSLKALALGAADYIPKPTSTTGITAGKDFQRDLIAKVKSLAAARRGGARAAARALTSGGFATRPSAAIAAGPEKASRLYGDDKIVLRKASLVPPRVLAIGSSTGGPQALAQLMGTLKGMTGLPILITQHMPATFTTILAQHLGQASGLEAHEGIEGESIRAGTIYVAPGGRHMLVDGTSTAPVIRLNDGPPENYCRPAVDPMLRSIAKVYGSAVLTVILTGMGQDGLKGSEAVVAAGGTIVAQDAESSVVWGMPGAVATGGVCSAVVPLAGLADCIRRIVGGKGTAA